MLPSSLIIPTTGLLKGNRHLEDIDGIAFVGGFTFSDVLGAAEGWYKLIVNNPKINRQFKDFYSNKRKFSLGVCNGCQLMAKVGWVKGNFTDNQSGRFESRWSTVEVQDTNSIFLKEMAGTRFGIWVANGEGRYLGDRPVSMSYISSSYPENPSGSDHCAAGVSSTCGRHLALMPHCERSFLRYQCPWSDGYNFDNFTPWFKIFTNAQKFCVANK